MDAEHLQRLVVEVTAANPQFVQRGANDRVHLTLHIQWLPNSHTAREELKSADDMKQNRPTLRMQAQGLLKRTEMLQVAAGRLQRQT